MRAFTARLLLPARLLGTDTAVDGWPTFVKLVAEALKPHGHRVLSADDEQGLPTLVIFPVGDDADA